MYMHRNICKFNMDDKLKVIKCEKNTTNSLNSVSVCVSTLPRDPADVNKLLCSFIGETNI